MNAAEVKLKQRAIEVATNSLGNLNDNSYHADQLTALAEVVNSCARILEALK